MDYASCLRRCIAGMRSDGDETESLVALYLGYPVPSLDEWDDVLRETMTYDDVDDPFACMAQYEMRLDRRGLPTAIGMVVQELQEQVQKLAESVGVPDALVPDAIHLLVMTASAEINRH